MRILSAIVLSFSAALVGAGCASTPEGLAADDGVKVGESAAACGEATAPEEDETTVAVPEDEEGTIGETAIPDEEGMIAEDGSASSEGSVTDAPPVIRPVPRFCLLCRQNCVRRLRFCTVATPIPGRISCRLQFRRCMVRCELICHRP
jgi:hypothetical protein